MFNPIKLKIVVQDNEVEMRRMTSIPTDQVALMETIIYPLNSFSFPSWLYSCSPRLHPLAFCTLRYDCVTKFLPVGHEQKCHVLLLGLSFKTFDMLVHVLIDFQLQSLSQRLSFFNKKDEDMPQGVMKKPKATLLPQTTLSIQAA